MTRHKFLELAAVIAAAHLCVVLLVAILPLPGGAFILDVLLVPLDLVWFPTHTTPLAEGGIVVLSDNLIWVVAFASIVAVRGGWKARRPT